MRLLISESDSEPAPSQLCKMLSIASLGQESLKLYQFQLYLEAKMAIGTSRPSIPNSDPRVILNTTGDHPSRSGPLNFPPNSSKLLLSWVGTAEKAVAGTGLPEEFVSGETSGMSGGDSLASSTRETRPIGANQHYDQSKSRSKKLPSNIQIVEGTEGAPRLYHCTICGKKFRTKVNVKYHEYCLLGDEEKPYQCSLCGKKFISKSHFEYHVRVHSGERPYKCPECEKGFNQRSKVTRHLRTHSHPPARQAVSSAWEQCLNVRSREEEEEDCRDELLQRATSCSGSCPHSHLILEWTDTTDRRDSHDDVSGSGSEFNAIEKREASDMGIIFNPSDSKFENQNDLNQHAGQPPHACELCSATFRRQDNLERHRSQLHLFPSAQHPEQEEAE